jgi:putative acetyltransferase
MTGRLCCTRQAREAHKWHDVMPEGESGALVAVRAGRWPASTPHAPVTIAVTHEMLSRTMQGNAAGDLMQIRRGELADEEALASIRRHAILALAVPAMSREQAETWAARAAADRIARAISDHEVWVAVDPVAIGWVEVDRDRVAALYVLPSHSRRGVGSALLARAETSIRSAGYPTVRLESSHNALDFYLRRGFRRCGPPDTDGAWPLRKGLPRTEAHGSRPT